MWNSFKDLIFLLLQQIEAFTGDWGLAIIILTVLMRLVLWPITAKQVKATYDMQKVQPEMKKIQAKYADDKEKQNEEMMKLYAEHKVNPFSSCLPMLLQMPIFIALYQVLGGTPEKPGQLMQHLADTGVGSFFGIIPNLSLAPSAVFKSGDYMMFVPYLLLIVIFGLSAWLPQALMPGEKSQKMIGLYMGVFLLFVGWGVPAGVLLYWDTSSLLQIFQQQITQKALKSSTSGGSSSSEIVVDEPETKSSKKKAKASEVAQLNESNSSKSSNQSNRKGTNKK